jgi:hypothetical protein
LVTPTLPLSESITAWVALEDKLQMGALAPDPEEGITDVAFAIERPAYAFHATAPMFVFCVFFSHKK